MKFAIALSGGGVRAAVFHCGVLQRLALDRFLERITFVSTVSGGSLVTGLIVCRNSHRWPTSEQYLDSVLPQVAECLTTATLQWSYTWRSLALPWRLAQGRAHILAKRLEAQWGIGGSLQRLPVEPRWIINATCYETGKNWRFSQPRMGDYLTHYVLEPDVPISDAIAASSAVPGLIGPFVIRSDRYEWHRYKGRKPMPTSTCLRRYELWDGGVYDNLGVEPLFKSGGGFREGFDLLLVSDASASLNMAPRTFKRMIKPGHRVLRLVNVATDQIRGLRSRAVVTQFMRAEKSGAYFRIGNTVDQIYAASRLPAPVGDYLSAEDVKHEATFSTTLRRLTQREFTRLLRHGFEVADATLATRLPDHFAHREVPG
ncbi:MAG: patatin-like phospholipase family protein [Gammaproteobacteria bacterium]|nr:patatin-like phospholipase family protein [Gammaproteobacteria bacterium]